MATFALGQPNPERKKPTRNKPKVTGHTASKGTWRLLPSQKTQGFDLWIDTLRGNTFFSKRADLLQSMTAMEKKSAPSSFFPKSSGSTFHVFYKEKAEIVLGLLHKNQELRWTFKRFFTKARIARFSSLNEYDPITLEEIQQPISVPLFLFRKIYRFEARSFATFVHKQLLTNDGQIPTPVYPKNPLTNEEISLAQLLSLLSQCKSMGYTSWAIESFLQCRCDIGRFLQIQNKSLRLHALQMTMSDPKSWDFIDTLYDFIKFQHSANTVPFQKNLYRWAVNHASSSPRMDRWKRLCMKWYEIDILYEDLDMKQEKQNSLSNDILKQCVFPQDLKDLHIESLR